MATFGGRTNSSLEDLLFSRGFEFDFFQAVRLLGRVFPNRDPVGETARPSDEVVRFGAWLSLMFPASAIDSIERVRGSGQQVRMTVTFLALTGVQGILPLSYTERLMKLGNKGKALSEFLDIFNHRLLSLFYRAWAKHSFPVQYEIEPPSDGKADPFTQKLFDLIGIGTSGLRDRMDVFDESMLRYAGLLAQRPHSASALGAVLRDYFGVPIHIDQFVGSWYDLESADRCYLSTGLERNQLGEGAFLGDKVWDQQGKFRISVGPLSYSEFQDFLPNGRAMSKLRTLTRFMVGQVLSFCVQLVLRAPEVPDPEVAQSSGSPRLGWSAWLKTAEFSKPATEAVFTFVS